ncbi:MAG: ZIP family metal transporter [Planctomycetota bacterium]
MATTVWIVVFGFLMSFIALIGSVTLIVKEATLDRLLLPLVAFASGSLIGGAFFHMLPAAVEELGNGLGTYLWFLGGFLAFLALEQLLHWHHCHRPMEMHREPLGYLILIADALHNLLGGLAVGAMFVIDFRLGLTAWLAAAAHEVPQELGDFAVLVHGGWSRKSALVFNFASALTFPVGGLLSAMLSQELDIRFLIPFAAGNFLYIGAVDLIPEFKERCRSRADLAHIGAFVVGLSVLLAMRLVLAHSHA